MASPLYGWNRSAGRYVDSRGRFVSRESVISALEKAQKARTVEMEALSKSLQSGKITLEEWAQSMRRHIKTVHLYSASAAKGGWAQMTSADWGRMGAEIRFHYQRLDRFALQIANGEVSLSNQFLARVRLYSGAGTASYYMQEEGVADALGRTEERNVLGTNENHCRACLEATARGWVPLGTLPKPGRRTCLGSCHCRLIYR